MGACASTTAGGTTVQEKAVDPSDKRIVLLKSMSMFQDLPDAAASLFAATMEESLHVKGSLLGKEGDPPKYCYIISEGTAEVTKNGKQLMLLRRGDIIGVAALLDRSALDVTITVTSDTQASCFRIDQQSFDKIVSENASIGMSISRYLTKELRDFSAKLSALKDIGGVNNADASDDSVTTIVLYDHKPYERHFFDEALQALNRECGTNKPARVKYVDAKLSLDTVHYANGAKIVCIFVNDNASSEVLKELRMKNVEMVALRCAGFNNCDLASCKDFGISAARVPAYSPYAVAEHCAALLLVINRKIHLAYNRVRTGNFSLNHLVGFDIHGKTVGVIGTGKIGYCFIQIMLGFGCNIVCYDMHPNPELVANSNVRYVDNMDDLLRASNILSIHCPLLANNKHMINKDSIALMPKGAIIINTSRGGLIKTVDLIDALKTGHIGGAGLDVYEDEQTYFFEDKSGELLCDDILARLLSFQNVVVTSHQAFLTEEALTAIANVTMQNVKEFLFEGKKMKALSNTVNID